ncbi:hypothetical protein BOTBODRAFT_419087 [Botryobasidium botryosum FD-172 SS1]|uniref:Glutamine synthetase n=1 Tax=Botryobasidium botryosum (strain FD-172 SS1) TaxID=930990 RepID=A0A067MK57_BOTB1|nr:hypothetical protein BOTBODRAFT_419087 [Botryobasidium botryosum FD-172 SS1]
MIFPTADAPKNLDELKDILKNDTKVKVAGIDIDGVLRGKIMSKDKFIGAAKSGFGFCSIIFGWDIQDGVYTKELLISNRKKGYGDLVAQIDLSTYRRIPWESNIPFFLVSFLDPDTREPICACPRGALLKASIKVKEFGWECIAGVEYEYFQFKETPHSISKKNFSNLEALTPGLHGYSLLRTTLNQDYFHEIFDQSLNMGIEIESHHTETGPGVYESALAHTQAFRMADNATLFKFVAKSVGMKYGIIPSFMAKPWGNAPACGGHIHVSLRDSNGRNVFALSEDEVAAGGRADAKYKDLRMISQEAEWFLGGVLEGLPDIMPMLVPTINGYKRLIANEWVFGSTSATYGYDSRTSSVRIISPPSVPPSATRFEIRTPGSDVLPHLALSAIFFLGIRGIEQKISPPCAPVTELGDDRSGVRMLAKNLEDATRTMMREGSIAREVFGDDFVEHFGGTRMHEVKKWNAAVTNWEREFARFSRGYKC